MEFCKMFVAKLHTAQIVISEQTDYIPALYFTSLVYYSIRVDLNKK